MEQKNGKKKITRAVIVIIALIILLFPIKLGYKDGGTVEYKAIVYSVTDYHSIHSAEGEYRVGYTIEIFGLEVFDNTRIEKIY